MENLEFIGKDNVTFVSKGSTHICIPLNYLKVLSYLKKLMTKIDQEEDCMFNLVTVYRKMPTVMTFEAEYYGTRGWILLAVREPAFSRMASYNYMQAVKCIAISKGEIQWLLDLLNKRSI